MIRGICLPEIYYADPTIQCLILQKFQGILFAGDQQGYRLYSQNKAKLQISMSLNGSILDEQLRIYIDEPISTTNKDNEIGLFLHGNKAIIGESNPNNFPALIAKYPNCQITYTSYSSFLCRIWGMNIPIPFSNQIRTWEMLQAKYGSKFPICWINYPKNKGDYKELYYWATSHNKEVWYYFEPDQTKEQIINMIESL